MSIATRLAVTLLAAPLVLAGCAGSSDDAGASSAPADAAPCPTTPVEVVVSVDQWGDVVRDLGGACAKVTTLLASSSVDPHDYEPSPADAAKFAGAQLVVVNGGHYDEWAAKLAAGSAPEAPIVDAVLLSGGEAGHDHDHDEAGHDHDHAAEGNPHVWYSPTAVTGVADAVTSKLTELAPDAADYFAERRGAWTESMKPYDAAIAAIKQGATGKTYAATESVFDDMAAALGLRNGTPQGYQTASSNEADPSPADLDAFLTVLRDKQVDVLIYNTQTEGSVPEQIRQTAESAGVPVVEVTETVAPGTDSFEAWQVAQLTSLAKALGVAV
ncbi:metal ABC transporter solute-binding protein, Zn/Mn family [Mycolicibacterium sediminis]|uniref:ABC transporter substrate-binding protein n=1 Tax=Mycolicibacterium sediminis TaxID=1286180 RepID=A0A7I7QJB3_9MYCO|nr:zinc ABC transporter substrate-binding protein [Mycolicibacterium sediminis]BBY26167.1 ABC transporter substrate-binding protein [Mycolicibacterium sediminis]